MEKSPKDKEITSSPRNKKVRKPKLKPQTTPQPKAVDGTIEVVGEFTEGEPAGPQDKGEIVSRETFDPPMVGHTNIAESLIAQAINSKVDVGTMEKLLAMRRELKEEFAREAFNRAMAAFQSECPIIKKTKEVKTNDGDKAYGYAPIESIITQVRALIKKHGFSYSVNTETRENEVKSICRVTHEQGHSECTEMTVPIVLGTKIMSNVQKVASSLTFAKRYAFCNALGIMTGDEDTDGIDPDIRDDKGSSKSKTTAKTDAPKEGKFDKAKEVLSHVKDPLVIIEFKSKIAASEKYSDDEKREIEAYADECLKKFEKV